ncbi:MAG TPA: hypothetical protein VGE68_07715 [Sphingomicrobium sp.]
MAYGFNPRLFVENGPAVRAAEAHASRSSDAFRAWGGLDSDKRLALIENALRRPANDEGDLPLAL